MAALFGSSLGRHLAGDDLTVGILSGSLLGAVGLTIGRTIDFNRTIPVQISGTAENPVFAGSARDIWLDFPNQLASFTANAAIGAMSSWMTMSLGEALGLEGFGAEIFSTGAGTLLNHTLQNVASNLPVLDRIVPKPEKWFSEGGTGGAAMASAFASFFGAKLGSLVVAPQTQAAVTLSSLGSAAGTWALTTSSLSWGGSISSFFTGSSTSWWGLNFIAPGIGAFIGFVLGAFIGNLFGKKKPRIPTANAEVALQIPNATYALGTVTGNVGGNLDLVRSMGMAARDTLNGLIETITRGDPNAKVANPPNLMTTSQWYGHTGGQLWVRLGAQNAAIQNVQSADEAVDKGVLYALPATQIIGGDLFLKRALYNMVRNPGQVKSVAQLAGDLQIAEDYAFYLQNREIIDAMIAEPWTSMSQAQKDFYTANKAFMTRALAKESVPLATNNPTLRPNGQTRTDVEWYADNQTMVNSIINDLNLTQFAAAWIITLQRAAELELNRTAVSDFYGGAKGFVDSLGITMTGGAVDYELIRFRMDGNALVTRYAPGTTNASDNLIVNGDMGGGAPAVTQEWSAANTPYVRTVETIDGEAALVLRKAGGDVPGWHPGNAWGGEIALRSGEQQNGFFAVTAGESLAFSVKGKRLASGVTLHARFDFLMADGSRAGGGWSNLASDAWGNLQGVATAPAGAVGVTFAVWAYRPDGNASGRFDFALRDFQLHRVPAGAGVPAWAGAPYEEFRSENFLADASYTNAAIGQNTSGNDYTDARTATTAQTIDDYRVVQSSVRIDPNPRIRGDEYWVTENTVHSGGNDLFFGSAFNDVLRGRAGNDWLDGGAGADTLFGGNDADVLIGGGGVDVLFGEGGEDVLIGGEGDDNPWWTTNPNHPFAGGLLGGDGDDRLRGGRGTDYILGENSNDLIEVDQDAEWDFMDGGAGSDTLSYARFEAVSQAVGVTVALGVGPGWVGAPGSFTALSDSYASIENLTGSNFNDSLTGDGQANVLKGLAGDDQVNGGGGDDTIEGGAGADKLNGDGGADTAAYKASTTGVWVDLTANEAFGGDAEGDQFTGIENLSGSNGADTFKGTTSANRLTGLKGDDWFIATTGADVHEGGDGFDTVDYADFTGALTIDLQGNWGSGSAAGHTFIGIEHLVGSQAADSFFGTAADEVFTGGKGNDVFQGRSGSDTYVFERGDGVDTVTETWDGSNTLSFTGDLTWNDVWFSTPPGNLEWGIIGTGDKVISINNWDSNQNNKLKRIDMGGAGAIEIQHINFAPSGASDADNTIWGMSWGRDMIFAYNGNDVIYGANGGGWEQNGNVIGGGRGNDTIFTSVGDDQFVFERGAGIDTITDAGGEDMIIFGPTVAAEDVITEVVGRDLYIGVRDLANRNLKASQVADRVRVIDGGTVFVDGWSGWETHNTIEFVRAGGAEIDLRKLNISWNRETTWSGGGGGGGGGGGDGMYLFPVVFDLGNDGLDLISVEQSTVAIDGGLDSPSLRLGWVGEQDGLLALDRNGDGKITRLSEISFIRDKAGAKTDMEGLQAYDSNGDGVLDAKDTRWGEFRIWRDANGNARGSGKELMTLAEAGITSLSLTLSSTGFSRKGMTDNLSLNTAVFTRSDGTKGTAHDVALATRSAQLKGLATGDKRPEWKKAMTDGEFGVLKAQNGKALPLLNVSKGSVAPEQKIRIDKSDANDGKDALKKITPKKGSLSVVAIEQRKGTVAGPSAGPGAPLPDTPVDNVVLRSTAAQFADGSARTAYDVALGSRSGLALALAGSGVDPASLSNAPIEESDLPGQGLTPWSLSRDLRRLISEGPRDLELSSQPERLQPFASVDEDWLGTDRKADRQASMVAASGPDEGRDAVRPDRMPLDKDGTVEMAQGGGAAPSVPQSGEDMGGDPPESAREPAFLRRRGLGARWWVEAGGSAARGRVPKAQSLSALMEELQPISVSDASIAPRQEGSLTDLTQSIYQLRQSMAALGGHQGGGEAALSDTSVLRQLRNPMAAAPHWRRSVPELA